jgi:hypothetical protein
MSLTKTVGLFAGTTLAISGVAFGAAEQTNTAAEIAQLKAEIAGLKAAQGEQWLTEQRASEIRGIVTDVLADADTRSSLQGSGAGAGYNGGFFMSSADGNYSMKINLLEQIRWTFNDQSNADDEQASGFENKRTRLTFSGGMVDSSWSYKVGYYLGYSNSAENFGAGELSDANVTKDFGNGFGVTVGQFKLPFSAEYGLDAGNLQFNDYSVVNTLSGTGYGQGLNLGYSADAFRVNFAYVNAIGEVNENWGNINPDYAFAIRGEYKIAGNWAQFNDGQSWKGEEFGAVIGVGYANENPQVGDDSPTWFTVDATLDFGGANLALAYYTTSEVGADDTTGFTVGGGVFLSDDFELAARYENFEPDGGDDLNTMTINGNWYLAKNTAKLGLAWGYAFDAVPAGAEYAGWVDSGGEDGEWFFQAQMSFNF